MKRVFRWSVLTPILIVAACSDATTAPPVDPGDDPPASFEIEVPETITQGQAFTLAVTALDDAGLPETAWRGNVTLTASGGTLSPASIELVNGAATVQVTLSGHAGAVTIQAANGSVQSEAVAAMVLSGQAPARLEIVPAAALLTGTGATQPFEVRAFDAQGAPTTAAQVTWTSNDAATLTIDAAGLATAQAAVGSAMIVATANGVESAPALVLVASPAVNAVLLADSQIVSAPVAVDPAAAYEPGWQYRVRVQNAAPQVGEIVIGTGEQPLAGRVVGDSDLGGDESELTVELMPLNQLFTDLIIDERIPMIERVGGSAPESRGRGAAGDMPAGFAVGMAETEFTLGRFDCKASGEVPSLDLPSPTLDINPDLHLQIGYHNGLERLAVAGTVSADFGYKPVFEATFEGKATCETVLRTFTIPAWGIISWFYGVQVPLGIGFTLDGKLEIAQVGFDISANATATVELGVSCPGGGACTGLDTFDMTRDGELEFIAPDPSEQFRVQLGGHAFVFARPFLGSLFTDALSFEFVDATAGLKQTIDLATTHRQVEDTAYASSFNLQFLATVGAGKDLAEAIQSLGRLLGTDLGASFNLYEVDDTLATSPKGTFTITPPAVEPGDSTALGEMATFTVELDPVTYLGLYAVDKVEFFWKHENEDSTFTLGPGRPSCVDVASSSGQTTFECETDFLDDTPGEQTFHAFVHAKLFGVTLPLPLEIAADAEAIVNVTGACPAPPDWAEFAIVEDVYAPQDNSGSASADVLHSEYKHLSVASAVQADSTNDWVPAHAYLRASDWIYIIPLERFDTTRSVFLPVQVYHHAEAFASDADGEAHASTGNGYWGGTGANGEATPGTPVSSTVNELVEIRMTSTDLNRWLFWETTARTYTRVRAHQRSARAASETSYDVLDYIRAEDGSEVPILICAASGTAY